MDRLFFFKEGTAKICGSLDINEAMQECRLFLKSFMPLNCLLFGLFEPENGAIRILALAADFPVKYSGDIPIALSEESKAYMKSHTGQMLVGDSVGNSPHTALARELARALGLPDLTGVGMPLRIKGEQLGGLGVLSQPDRPFTQNHIELLELLHDPFAIALSNHLRHREVLRLKDLLADDNRYLQSELHRISGNEIVGERFGLKDVMRLVNAVAPMESPVLLLGETGVGKEVIANAIHYSSPRRSGPLVKVNCGAIPQGLIDNELFGHEKGAFTGASTMLRGRFERAEGGTLFLDEVGELPLAAQVRLLRVLQEKVVERVGGSQPISVNVRVIAATHRDLQSMVQRGEFREDLWYRINVIPIRIPPLRERRADIPALVYHFIERKRREMNLRRQPVLAEGALERLKLYDWPGNVRELENAVERELIRSQAQGRGSPLRFEEIEAPAVRPQDASPAPGSLHGAPDLALDTVLRAHIAHVLGLTNGRIQGPRGAASLLGVQPNTLRHRMRKLGIPYGVRFTVADPG
ncbi:MAG: sigma 54-interacting transcriptional regulator [Desulfobacterales bacterium]|nr:sigma 54-interacting transcriptional regulator [Desulfobacterales bacterium]